MSKSLNTYIRRSNGSYVKPKKGDVIWVTDSRREIVQKAVCVDPYSESVPGMEVMITYDTGYRAYRNYYYPDYHLSKVDAEEFLFARLQHELARIDRARKRCAAKVDAQANRVALAKIEAGLDPNG